VGVGVRIWIAVVATLVLGVGAFISIAAVGQIHHDDGCSQYHNALVAITTDLALGQTPATEDLNFLTADERNKLTEGLGSAERAIQQHPSETALFLDSLVASAMAEHGC
jgi:hypothetical protein